jgi:hypothetical protein
MGLQPFGFRQSHGGWPDLRERRAIRFHPTCALEEIETR